VFPGKRLHVSSLNGLLYKLQEAGTMSSKLGSGRPRSACTDENIDAINALVLRQEDVAKTH